MAIVVVQVGQCGNQLGDELWRQLALATNTGNVPSPFFTRDCKARCVLVDSEPKVVHDVYKRHAGMFRAENVVCGQSGRGNHWALGYYGVSDLSSNRNAENAAVSRPFQVVKDQRRHDNNVVRNALRAIYAETRRARDADGFEAIIILHSLVGGTGSGMASLLLEKIRYYFVEPVAGAPAVDECAEAEMMRRDGLDGMVIEKRRALYLVSVTVAPRSAGELSLQGINAALTLHALQENADVVLLLRNDDCFASVESSTNVVSKSRVNNNTTTATSLLASFIRPCTTYKEINEVFITMLMPIFLYGRQISAVETLVSKCSPNYKEGNNILTILPIPQRNYLRFKESVTLSRFYVINGVRQNMPGTFPSVPVEQIHNAHSLQTLDSVYSREEVHLPRELLQSLVQTVSSQRTVAALLLKKMDGVLVMNELSELNAAVLFPLLRSAAVKVKAGAFLSTFEDMGLTAECIESAIREVAARLSVANQT